MKAFSRFLASNIGLTIAVVLVIGAIFCLRSWRAAPTPGPMPSAVNAIVSHRPDREITSDHRIKRIRHKDATGLSPLELVQTPAGMVTIRRTFSAGGTLLREEAFLQDKPVALPND
ncbi:MAG: hypothetical protein ACJ8M1_12535 [Chthoniobacterales bacterium]